MLSDDWESRCRNCGSCCFEKIEDEQGTIFYTRTPCRYLDVITRQCRVYDNRFAINPECVKLTAELVPTLSWLPRDCGYVAARQPDMPHLPRRQRSRKKKRGAKEMNSYRILFLAFTLLLISALRLPADEIATRVGAGLLVTGLADNMSGRGESTISSLSDRPENVTRITPIMLVDIRRTKDRDTFFFGTPLDEQAAITLGYRRSLDAGAVTGSLFYSLFGKEWRNPYLVGSPRRDTTVYNYGGKLVFEEISGTPLSAEFKTTVKKVEHEDLTGDLRRNGVLVETGLSWKESLGSGWTLTPSAGYRRGQYEGAASSFNGGTVAAALSWKDAKMMISGKASGLIAAYEAHNPLFNKTRNDLGYRLQGTITWTDPLGWNNTYATFGYIHGDTRSNIDFYEISSNTGYALAGYRF